jgi:titin
MATLTIGTASGGFFNFRGANSTPYAMGSSVAIQNTGGDINTTGGYEGVVCTQLTFQASGYTTTSSLYGNVWNSSGTSITNSVAVSAATDTTAPFGSKTFNLSDQFFSTPQTIYVGYSRAAASPTAWDCVNGDNTTRVGNTAGSAPSGLTGTGTGTIYRRLVGTLTYTLYDAGNISQSASQPSNLAITLTFAGTSPTYGKNISINWGDGTTTDFSVAAGATPAAQTKTYASAGAKTITTTLSHASTSVGIPNLTLTSSPTVYTVPSEPRALSSTAGNGSVALSWVAPSYVGSGTVNYHIYIGGSFRGSTTGLSFTDTGLTNGTTYTHTVYALNTWGTGGSASLSSTPFTVPSTPSVTATPGNGSISITFSSASDGGSVIYYYQYSLDNTNWSGAISSPYNITGLTNGTSYTVYVRAVNLAGNSGSGSASATPRTVPNAPYSDTYATSTFSSSLSSTFSVTLYISSAGDGGSAITDYQYSLDNTNWTSLGLPVGGTRTVSGLTKTTYYTVYVRAVNAAGNSSSTATTWTSYDPTTGAQYNTTSFSHGGRYKTYVDSESYGTEWAPLYMKKYNGTAWVDAPIEVYNGTVWGYTDV